MKKKAQISGGVKAVGSNGAPVSLSQWISLRVRRRKSGERWGKSLFLFFFFFFFVRFCPFVPSCWHHDSLVFSLAFQCFTSSITETPTRFTKVSRSSDPQRETFSSPTRRSPRHGDFGPVGGFAVVPSKGHQDFSKTKPRVSKKNLTVKFSGDLQKEDKGVGVFRIDNVISSFFFFIFEIDPALGGGGSDLRGGQINRWDHASCPRYLLKKISLFCCFI